MPPTGRPGRLPDREAMVASDKQEPDVAAIAKDPAEAVNMTPVALETWLGREESRSVGQVPESKREAVGHEEGRRIVAIRRKKKADLTAEDYAHMRKVVGYVRRHLAQGGPKDDAEHSRWRYSLMNWGHDPLKKERPGRTRGSIPPAPGRLLDQG